MLKKIFASLREKDMKLPPFGQRSHMLGRGVNTDIPGTNKRQTKTMDS